MIECLSDTDADIRRLAVGVLALKRLLLYLALPLIIERLSDEDRLTRLSTLSALQRESSPLPKDVIPYLDKWLERNDPVERINAMAGISKADPNRGEFLSDLWEALNGDDLGLQEFSMEYFGIKPPETTDDVWANVLSSFLKVKRSHQGSLTKSTEGQIQNVQDCRSEAGS